jgi:hypothetical protein
MAGVNYTTSEVGLRDRWNIDFEEEPPMAENKMAQVAQMFGKQLNEAFIARYDGILLDCRFTENGFESCPYGDEFYDDDADMMQFLILGEAEIVEDEK